MYAQWIVQYTITLNGNGGSPITATITGNAGMKVEEPTNKKPARDNYEFLAWYTEAEGGDAIDWSSYTLTKNVTMYAHWTKQTVALNSVTADGQASPSFEPTTTVTLTFAKDVPGLTADQIEFEADFARVAKGKLVSKGNGVYELPVDALAEEENGGVEFTVTAPDASTKVTLYAWIEVADKDTLASIGTDATTLSRWYKQTKDITIANTWTTIGTSNSNSFTGVYDGGDKEIIPDKITSTANFGIFYYTTGAKLKNIHIGQGEMTTTGTSIGGIVFTAADTEITDCSNAAMLSGKNAGGICGVINNGTIIDRCWNTGTITATNTSATASAGGIHNSKTGSDRTAVIKNCYNTGTITATSSSGNATAGGISGSPTLRLDVIACYNTGTVTANGKTTSYAGGIVGSGNKYEITACANRGTVTSSQILTANTHKVYLGGITGRIGENTVKVTASYNTGAVSWTGSDNNSNGGIGCTGGVIGFITVDAVNLATACYWTTADSSPIHGIGYITTSATDGSNAGTYKFGSAWPSAGSNDGQHAAWGTGKQDGSGEGHYWASLGGSPSNYPRLWFEN
jgi:uncharacterized repeat protein (TIGR02543 family)